MNSNRKSKIEWNVEKKLFTFLWIIVYELWNICMTVMLLTVFRNLQCFDVNIFRESKQKISWTVCVCFYYALHLCSIEMRGSEKGQKSSKISLYEVSIPKLLDRQKSFAVSNFINTARKRVRDTSHAKIIQ